MQETLFSCDQPDCESTVRTSRGSIISVDDWLSVINKQRDLHFCGMTCLREWAEKVDA